MMEMPMFAQLYIIEAGHPERTIAVHGTTTIGRDDDNDIVLAAFTVSRCHAVLLGNAAGVQLIDLESTNGTFVNGVPVPPDQPLRLNDGDLIQLGQVLARYSPLPHEGGDSLTPSEPTCAMHRLA
jgi:pSer/pThr/pTyr-binding forkhead associated (FHA) protein